MGSGSGRVLLLARHGPPCEVVCVSVWVAGRFGFWSPSLQSWVGSESCALAPRACVYFRRTKGELSVTPIAKLVGVKRRS